MSVLHVKATSNKEYILLEVIKIFVITQENGIVITTFLKKECRFHGKQHKNLI